MSDLSRFIIVIGCVALAVILFNALRNARVQPDPQAPADWSGSDEAQIWDEKASAMRSDFGIKPIRDVATKWAGSIAALGILSTVAFIAGPKDLVNDVGGSEAEIAAWLILAAAALAAIGLTYAVLAEQGYPQWTDDLNGWTYRSLTQKRAEKSAQQLQASRYLVLGALLLIILATAIAWMTAMTGEEKLGGQNAIVETDDGIVCGQLVNDTNAVKVSVGAERVDIKLSTPITLVDACPAGP